MVEGRRAAAAMAAKAAKAPPARDAARAAPRATAWRVCGRTGMGALVASDGGAAVPVHPSARVAREADARGLALAVALVRADRDGDGHIEPKELARVMSDLGCPQTKERIAEIIQGVDTDGNGMIEFDEFIGIMATRMLKSDGAGAVSYTHLTLPTICSV